MKIRTLALLLFAIFAANSAISKPKLVVNIVVGQMRYDYLLRFNNNFTEKGFKLMINQGISCDRAMYDYLYSSTPAGLATISTGANPSTHGVIGMQWYNYTSSAKVELVRDNDTRTIGTDELDAQVSPRGLIASTLGDCLKSITPQSKVVNIGFEAASSVIIGGHTADVAYWVSPREGNMVSSSYYLTKLPDWVTKFNDGKFAESYSAAKWTALYPASKYNNIFRKDIAVEADNGLSFDFLTRKKYDYERLAASPAANSLLKDFAIQSVIYENLGKDDFTDVLNIVFDPMRLIGERYGTQSMEIEDAYYRFDADLGQFIEFLETQLKKEDILVVLTSDHGAVDPMIESSKVPSGRFNKEQFSMLMNGFIGGVLGSTDRWILDYENNQIFLNRRLIYDKGLDLKDVQDKLAAFAIQFRGVAHAITSHSLAASHFSGGIMGKAQNSYYQRHSGDILINFLPGWAEESDKKLSDCGTSYNYDTHVPLLWYGGGVGTQNIARNIDMTDVAPTIAHIMEIAPPNASTGTPIIEIYSK